MDCDPEMVAGLPQTAGLSAEPISAKPFGIIEAEKITKGTQKGKATNPEATDFIHKTALRIRITGLLHSVRNDGKTRVTRGAVYAFRIPAAPFQE